MICRRTRIGGFRPPENGTPTFLHSDCGSTHWGWEARGKWRLLSARFSLINIKLDGPRLVDWCCFRAPPEESSGLYPHGPTGATSVHLIRLILLLLTAHWKTVTATVLLFLSLFVFFASHPFPSRPCSPQMNVFQSKYCCRSSWKREGQTDKCVRTHWHMNKPDTHSHLYSCNRAEPLSSMWDWTVCLL